MACKTRTMKKNNDEGKKKQSKSVKVMLVPVKILNKVAICYMKCMEDCAGKVGGCGGGESVVLPVPMTATEMPRSFNGGGRVSENRHDEEVKELVRMVSRRRSVSELELNVGRQNKSAQQLSAGVGIRNYSVRVGKIGRIDEDGPCSFEDNLICPKSRNHAKFIGSQLV